MNWNFYLGKFRMFVVTCCYDYGDDVIRDDFGMNRGIRTVGC